MDAQETNRDGGPEFNHVHAVVRHLMHHGPGPGLVLELEIILGRKVKRRLEHRLGHKPGQWPA